MKLDTRRLVIFLMTFPGHVEHAELKKVVKKFQSTHTIISNPDTQQGEIDWDRLPKKPMLIVNFFRDEHDANTICTHLKKIGYKNFLFVYSASTVGRAVKKIMSHPAMEKYFSSQQKRYGFKTITATVKERARATERVFMYLKKHARTVYTNKDTANELCQIISDSVFV